MGYTLALRAAGAEVLAFKTFGSYQGDWWAKVRYEGRLGWVHGSFGSCSHCDAFQSEFGSREASRENLAQFGRRYLDHIRTQADAERRAGREASWSLEDNEMLQWIVSNSIEGPRARLSLEEEFFAR